MKVLRQTEVHLADANLILNNLKEAKNIDQSNHKDVQHNAHTLAWVMDQLEFDFKVEQAGGANK